jgi:uncharacterized protein (UPF0333 family)
MFTFMGWFLMKSQKGQSLVEFALTLPVLILILFGIIDFSRIFYVYLTMSNTGREAARAASIGNDTAITIQANAVDHFNERINGFGMEPIPDSNVVITIGENEALVLISYEVNFLTPLIGSIPGLRDLTLEDTTRMLVE